MSVLGKWKKGRIYSNTRSKRDINKHYRVTKTDSASVFQKLFTIRMPEQGRALKIPEFWLLKYRFHLLQTSK